MVAKKEFKAAPARAELKEKRKEKEGKRTTGKPAKKEKQVTPATFCIKPTFLC